MLNRDFSYTALFHPPLQRLVLYFLDWIHQEVNHTNKKKAVLQIIFKFVAYAEIICNTKIKCFKRITIFFIILPFSTIK